MAATDTKRTGLQNQKRGVDVMVSDVLASSSDDGVAVASDGSTIGTLPVGSIIVGVKLVVITASDTSDTIDVTYGGSVVANEIAADATGVNMASTEVVAAAAYQASGGDIVVKDGSQATDSNFRGRVVIEYIQLDKVTGKYTN